VRILYLDRGVRDANPAHIIYEALTNTDWGMGSPSTLIDVASFEEAGVTLFDEPLGLSMIWTRQTTIQDFIQEVLNHINGVVFVDPQTGLLTLKLIRGDYDVDTLPSIDPSTANLTNFGRKLWGDIVNEINVTWTNPETEKDETVTAQDLASITTQGGIVTDSRNYYGARYAALAKALASRELRSAGAPLATCDAEVDRSMWALRPASVLLVNWPEYGLSDLVMRVTSIDYGKPGDPAIKLSLIEDVFGLDYGAYVDPPGTAWEDPSQAPTPVDEQEALTLPYFFAANATTSIVGTEYPEVLAGALAASSNTDTSQYELWGEVAQPDGSTAWESLSTLNIVAHGELAADINAEAVSAGIAFDNFIGALRPSVGGFALIGDGVESGREIALITGAGTSYNLSRGVLDTVPRAWPAGTPIWFIEDDSLIEDPTARSSGEVVDYRLLTRTSQGVLNLYAATLLEAAMTDRPWRPLRPANLTIGGVKFNSISTPVNMIGTNPIPVSWSNRNRLTEDGQVLGWTSATVTPETGQTTTLAVLKTDGTVLATHSGLTGSSYNVLASDFGTEALGEIRLSSSRTDADGTFESLQNHSLYVKVASAVVVPVGLAEETDEAFARTLGALPTGMSEEIDTALALSATVSDSHFSSVVLLLGMDGANHSTTFTDESSAAHGTAFVGGDAEVDTSSPKFGTGALKVATGYLAFTDHNDFSPGAGDFTIECWMNDNAVSISDALMTKWNGSTQHEWGFFVKSGDVAFFYSTTGSDQPEIHSTSTTYSAATWYHIAFSRVGNTGYLCFNGSIIATGNMTGVTIFNSTANLAIGANNQGSSAFFGGKIDEFRMTKGVGRYSGSVGASYTVPTSAFPRS
jgi:hypothetical protein